MKIRNIFILLASFALIQCSPKTGDQMKKAPEAVKDMSKDMSMDKAWRGTAPSAGPARKINFGEFNVKELDNGLTVVVVENHKLPRVSYSLSLKNDQINEKDKAGLVSFAGSLLGRGTTNRTKAEIDAAVDYLGASFSAFGSGLFGSSLTKHQGKLLEIMSDVLFNPSFDQEEFDKILTQNLSGLESSKTDPNAMAGNLAASVNYGSDHPYGEIETTETYNKLSVKDCKDYYNTYFKPNNAYLTIVGDITFNEAIANVEKYFGTWKKGTIPTTEYSSPKAPNEPRVCIANKDGAVQSVVRITYPINNKPASPDAEKISVMNNILGGGIFSGRLMQNLREDKAFTYGARSSTGSDRLVANFNAFASVRTEVTDSSIVEFLYEMERMVTEPVKAKDLQLVKNSMTGSFGRSLESPQTLARFARNIHRYNLPEDYYESYLTRLDAVTIQDVQAMAKKYLTPNNANIVVVGNKDEIADKLKRFDGDGEIEYFDNYGKKMENVNAALPSDITADIVLNDYINALGGKAKLGSLKTVELHYTMSLMGQSMNVSQYYKMPNSFYLKIGNEQMVVQEIKFDGTTAMMGGMGGNQKATEGPVFDQAKAQSKPFPQMDYMSSGYSVELKGLDNVNGASCYKLSVKNPAGETTTEYYDIKTNLLAKVVTVAEGPGGQQMTISNEYMDYKEIEGIPVPQKLKTTGAMPMPIEMTLKEAKMNSTLDASMFDIK